MQNLQIYFPRFRLLFSVLQMFLLTDPGQTSSRSIRSCFFAPAIYKSEDRYVHFISDLRPDHPVFRLRASAISFTPSPTGILPPCSKPVFYEPIFAFTPLAEE
jgi:hypothetical protein